jgi:hypothetical protein
MSKACIKRREFLLDAHNWSSIFFVALHRLFQAEILFTARSAPMHLNRDTSFKSEEIFGDSFEIEFSLVGCLTGSFITMKLPPSTIAVWSLPTIQIANAVLQPNSNDSLDGRALHLITVMKRSALKSTSVFYAQICVLMFLIYHIFYNFYNLWFLVMQPFNQLIGFWLLIYIKQRRKYLMFRTD